MNFRKYRRRTLPVDAVEVNLTNLQAIGRIPGCSVAASPMGYGVRVHVETEEGEKVAHPGDLITLDAGGNLEVMTPEDFREAYEPLEE